MKPPLHVVHIVYRFATGGLENGIVNLINHLPPEQYSHSIVCLTGHDPEFANRLTHPVHIETLDKRPGPDWKYLLPMWQRLRRLQPDIVHTRNLATQEYQLAAFCAGVPRRIHGEHGWDMGDLHGSNRRYVQLKRLLRPLINDFIALSVEGERYLIDQVRVAPRRCHRIINGVDTRRFCPDGPSAQPPGANFLADDPLIFGCVGRLATVKNHRMLADAFIALCREHPQQAARLRLVIVGEGEHFNALQAQFADAGITKQVWMAGNQQDIPAIMRLFDLFVLPSLAEGISNTILEALATGLPVIATAVGGNGDLIQPGHNGSLCGCDTASLKQAMASYLEQPERIDQERKNARKSALEHYSLETMIGKYSSLYQR